MEIRKFTSIFLTVRDRSISSKFLTHRVSKECNLCNFVQVLEQNSCFPLGGHYACQCVLFLVFLLNLVTTLVSFLSGKLHTLQISLFLLYGLGFMVRIMDKGC